MNSLLRIHPKDESPILRYGPVRLDPIRLEDAAELQAIAYPGVFRYFVTQMPVEFRLDEFESYIRYVQGRADHLGFVIRLEATGEVVGSSCYLDIRPADAHLEIGLTWYALAHQATAVNPASKMALLSYAFDSLGAEKVTLKCDGRNARSARAIQKLGAKPEGVLRHHRFTQYGEFRDTAYFGILREEWPVVKKGLLERLDALKS